ncbi:biopolymer transporter ExbD [Prevotella sp. oral taxon 475]|uniref:ExbD/TolR family protein n=1 Tax=Prevotella sp. oral taxon 475 TaxID=712471 RepID=UPI001BAD25D1|nr:biopolymer transporter ExbD [Prevotella sp. oral taxon 475]QUB47730.1 biopolymer transporter ExbD [Prevotella sp. oral taxon 475]
MGKVKIKKKSTWIDMTPMSDVMVLLLTFFMLTSTFVKNEPVKVVTPGSVSEIKVPEKNVLNILVDKTGKIFMSMDNQNDTQAVLEGMAGQFGVELTKAQMHKFKKDAMWGVPMSDLSSYLSLSETEMAGELKNHGIPTDSIDGKKSEFQLWVEQARTQNPDVKLAIKADESTPYAVVKKVMSELQDMSENRYYLITSYKKVEE